MEKIRGYDSRLKSILFSYTFQQEVSEVNGKIEEFFEFFKFMKNDKKIIKWLEYILAHGNYMNGTGSK